jgi:hypothetical protein
MITMPSCSHSLPQHSTHQVMFLEIISVNAFVEAPRTRPTSALSRNITCVGTALILYSFAMSFVSSTSTRTNVACPSNRFARLVVRDEYIAFSRRTGRSYLFSISDLTISEEPLDFLKKQTMTGILEANTSSSKLAWSVMVGMLIVVNGRGL